MARRRSRAEWVYLVQQYDAGGASMEDFSREHGLNAKTLAFWRSQLKPGSSYERRYSGRRRKPKKPDRTAVTEIEPETPFPHFPELTVRIVDRLTEYPGLRPRALSLALHYGQQIIERELQELEQLGILIRRPTGRGARWYLG